MDPKRSILKIYKFFLFENFFLKVSKKIYLKWLTSEFLSFGPLKMYNSHVHNKGANKPVINTWEKIFLIPGKYKEILLLEKFLIKTWEKYNEPHKKLPIEQTKPYLKRAANVFLQLLNLPNHNPHKTKPGICVKLLSGLIESKVSPINKPAIAPLKEPYKIDQGNNQNKGQ